MSEYSRYNLRCTVSTNHRLGFHSGRSSALALGVLAALGCCASPTARAETLYDAFGAAYGFNPTLAAQRAAVRVTQQDRAITATGYAPSVTATSDLGYEDTKGSAPGDPVTDSKTHPRGYGISLNQNVWNGFKTYNGVRRDEASLRAADGKLSDVEQQVLVDVATAYSDVIRDKAILELHRADHGLLESRAKETSLQFKIGNLTRTDVDQSDANLARSQADLAIAESNLEASIAAFRSVAGHEPGRLEPAAVPERLIPTNVADAVAVAENEHPAIRASESALRAAELNVDVEKSGYAPSVDFSASAQHRFDPDYYPAHTDLTNLSVVGKLTVPLYDRGLTFASVSRATEFASQRRLELDRQRELTRVNVVQNRGVFIASKLVIASADARVAASERALYGVELEATAGRRTTLDVLTAQRALLEARVDREIAQHDRIIAGYRLLASIGRLSLGRLTPADTAGRSRPPVVARRLVDDATLAARARALDEATGRPAPLVQRDASDPALAARFARLSTSLVALTVAPAGSSQAKAMPAPRAVMEPVAPAPLTQLASAAGPEPMFTRAMADVRAAMMHPADHVVLAPVAARGNSAKPVFLGMGAARIEEPASVAALAKLETPMILDAAAAVAPVARARPAPLATPAKIAPPAAIRESPAPISKRAAPGIPTPAPAAKTTPTPAESPASLGLRPGLS